MSRRDSREAAVKIIFQNMFTDSRLGVAGSGTAVAEKACAPDCAQMIEAYFECAPEEDCGELDKVYISSILEGVLKEAPSIDQYIIKNSKDWTIDRMSRIDLAIMRVAILKSCIGRIFRRAFRSTKPWSWRKNTATKTQEAL